MMLNLLWIHIVLLTTAFNFNVECRHINKEKGVVNITKIDVSNMTMQFHNISRNSTKIKIYKDIMTLVKTAGRSGGFGLLLARDILADVTDFLTDLFIKKEDYISEEEYYGNYEDIDASFVSSLEDDV